MTVSPFDHPFLSGLFGGEEMAGQFAWDEDHEFIIRFQEALAKAEAAEGVIPVKAAEAIVAICSGFAADLKALNAAAARDGVAIPEFSRQMRVRVGERYGKYVHFGATSQDVIDTSLILRIRNGMSLLEQGLTEVVGLLFELGAKFGKRKLTGVTRMQEALPVTVSERLRGWRSPLVRHLERIEEIKPRLLVLQFGGAVGTLDVLKKKGPAVARRLADELGLGLPDGPWHNQRDTIAEFAGWLSLVSGSLGKMGQDILMMAQNSVGEVVLSGGGISSAIPGKNNPVAAEILVALANFNATQLSAMHQALVHENERSGVAWTLEWLVLPQMMVASAGGLTRAAHLLNSIERIGLPVRRGNS